jgi:putative transposase
MFLEGGPLETTSSCSPDNLSEAGRLTALERFRIIRPFLDGEVSLKAIAETHNLPLRTARRWVQSYRGEGYAGLARKAGRQIQFPSSSPIKEIIQGLALRKPRPSVATIHRQVMAAANRLAVQPPSYSLVYKTVRQINPALMTLAQEGARGYSNTFDLIHRREAEGPNAVWQADHSELDILVQDEAGQARKPWLTIILDDYSRAVSGYLLSLSAPSAIQTALALRQAIWRKSQPGWHVCGIPKVLYTDHGCDFTSRHIEQVAAELKIELIFSMVGRPRGRGKVERFFESLSQVFLSQLPGYRVHTPGRSSLLSLAQLNAELERYLIDDYLTTAHSSTKQPPQARWEAGGFLPQMPESLEKLDLLLLTVPTSRQIRPDGIHFKGLRYIDPTLAAYVGEKAIVRFDPRDLAEIRVFYQDRFLCRAVCQELAGTTVSLREIVRARDRRRLQLQQTLRERRQTVDSLLEARRWAPAIQKPPPTVNIAETETKLKRYRNE